MKYEISAGGIIFKQTNKKFYILMLMDKNDNWTFPKGTIEENENPEEAAVREISEEVGICKIDLKNKLSPIQYWYKYNGELRRKTVHYFLFKENEEEIIKPQIDEGIKEAKWFEIEEAEKVVGYKKTNQKLLEETKNILTKL